MRCCCSSSSSRSRPSSRLSASLRRAAGAARRAGRRASARPRQFRARGRPARGVEQAWWPRSSKNCCEASRASSTSCCARGTAVFAEEAALRAGVEKVFERPVQAVAAERQAEVVRGHLGHGVRLVEHEKIVREKHAARLGGRALRLGAAGLDQREQQGVVDDDDLRRAQPGPGALVMAFLVVAVLARAGGGVGVDRVPDFRARRRFQVVTQAGRGRFRPLGDALQFLVVGVGERAWCGRRAHGRAGSGTGSSTCRPAPSSGSRRSGRGRATP